MRAHESLSYLATAAVAITGAAAQSWSTIPEIEVYGQHFFYTNNGSQLLVCLYMHGSEWLLWSTSVLTTRSYMKGVAYQQNYEPNGTVGSDAKYTDPLADPNTCARDSK
jgi:hypothetical protein